MKRVAILISGGGSNMVALVRSMTGGHPARPVLVLSNRPDAAGLARARALGVETDVVDHRGLGRAAFEDRLDARLDRAGAEIVCLAGFMRILSAGFTEARAGRMLNIHPSLLPKYPGRDTHARTIAAGEAGGDAPGPPEFFRQEEEGVFGGARGGSGSVRCAGPRPG